MEFEEMQKIWNEQKGEAMYAINESALHKTVKRRKAAASKRIGKVEIMLSLINGFCGIFLFVDALNDIAQWDYLGSLILLTSVAYIQWSRHQRLKAEKTYDRTILGELDHTIANTNSIIRISRLMIIGYLIPMSVLYFFKMIIEEASLDKWLLIAGMYTLACFLIIWERRKMHEPRRDNLIRLRKKLREEL